MVRPERFELPTYCSGGNRSIQLSYGRVLTSILRTPSEPLREHIGEPPQPSIFAALCFKRRHSGLDQLLRAIDLVEHHLQVQRRL